MLRRLLLIGANSVIIKRHVHALARPGTSLGTSLGTWLDRMLTRNDSLCATRHLGRAIWKRWSGDHIRSRIKAKMRGPKPLGEKIASRDPDRQSAQIHIRIALMNRFNALGQAEIERLA